MTTDGFGTETQTFRGVTARGRTHTVRGSIDSKQSAIPFTSHIGGHCDAVLIKYSRRERPRAHTLLLRVPAGRVW